MNPAAGRAVRQPAVMIVASARGRAISIMIVRRRGSTRGLKKKRPGAISTTRTEPHVRSLLDLRQGQACAFLELAPDFRDEAFHAGRRHPPPLTDWCMTAQLRLNRPRPQPW